MASTKSQEDQEDPLKSMSLPFKIRVSLFFLNLVTDTVCRTNGTVNRRLMNFVDRRVKPDPVPRNAVSSHDVTVDSTKNLWFRLFVPHNDTTTPHQNPLPVIVFFHGGGFAFLSAQSFMYDAVCRRFARKLNAVVCSVEYRLTPEHKFPSQYEDGFDVLNFLDRKRNAIEFWPENADVERSFIAGDSAGGNLAHHLAVKASESRFDDLKVIGLINIQPFFGGKESAESEVTLEGAPIVRLARTEWLWKAFLPSGVDPDHWSVNVSGPNAVDISGVEYPPTLLFIGELDPLKDWQRKYYDWLIKSGKDVRLAAYNGAIHAFYVFPELPQTNLLFEEINGFIHKQISKL